MTREKAQKMLKENGIDVTIEEAELILDFMRMLAKTVVSDYLSKPNQSASKHPEV